MAPPRQNTAPPPPEFSVIVPAAGVGRRMGADRKKPHLLLDGQPIIFHTLRRLRRCRGCGQIVLVLHPDEAGVLPAEWQKTLEDEFDVRDVTAGGATRQDSAWAGMQLVEDRFQVVLTHDGVRPFVRTGVVEKVAAEAAAHGGAVAAVPATATVKEVNPDHTIRRTHPREDIWLAQTPQGFRKDLLLHAYREARRDGFQGTDDAQLVERCGRTVRVVRDRADNIKITTPLDLAVAQSILHRQRAEGDG